MPQMSPLYWEILNLISTLLVVTLTNKMFFGTLHAPPSGLGMTSKNQGIEFKWLW